MPHVVICPGCGASNPVDDDFADTTFECHFCRQPLSVPTAHAPPPPPLPVPTSRACEDCGVGLDETNYGGWREWGGNRFRTPRRFYYCQDCWEEQDRKEAREEREVARARGTTRTMILVIVGGTIVLPLATLVLVALFSPTNRNNELRNQVAETHPPKESPPNEKPAEPAPRPQPAPLVIAPQPTPALTFRPPLGYTSDWKKIGVVEVRIFGVAVTKVPTTNIHNVPSDSERPALVIWVEVRTEATTRKVEFRRWQGLGDDSKLVVKDGTEIPQARLGLGHSFRTDIPFTQVVAPGEKPRAGILVYEVPSRDVGEVVLVLDAARVGETGSFTFRIPQSAFHW